MEVDVLGLVVVVVLGATVLIGTNLGGRYRVAPPVLLLLAGSLLGLVPRLAKSASLPPCRPRSMGRRHCPG